MSDFLKTKGYDGIINSTTLICAFYPNQIKLADGTNTTFDPKNPDIRFDKGGSLESLEEQDKEQMESQFGKNNI